MSEFHLDPRLDSDSLLVGNLPLCQVRLMDDSQYPWLILVPRRPELREPFDLSPSEQLELLKESRLTAQVLNEVFAPDKLNIATIGNVVAQLHMHHVARYKTDISWPSTVWGAVPAKPRLPAESQALLAQLREAFGEPLVTA